MTRLQFFMLLFVTAICSLLSGTLVNWAAQPAPSQPTPTLLTTSELRLVDESGRTRALLSILRGKPRLILIDDNGEFRLELGLGQTGEPSIGLRDRDGKTKAQLFLSASNQAGLKLFDASGRVRANLGLSSEGSPGLIMSDDAGKDRLALWQEKDEIGLALADSDNRPRAGLTMKKNDRSTIAFYDRDGKTIWYAPQP
ncbi:MAG: hypothetical protein HQK55_02420 [Deltaproteobacteria bacterium]|nr:hypothetical protein [Deltaproteobacteria bacterium]